MNNYKIITLLVGRSTLFEAQLVLTQNDIEFEILDELSQQILPATYGNIIGGTRLKVREADYEKANQILIEQGFIKPDKPSAALVKFDRITSKFFLIGGLRIEWRLIILVSMGVFILAYALYFISVLSVFSKK